LDRKVQQRIKRKKKYFDWFGYTFSKFSGWIWFTI